MRKRDRSTGAALCLLLLLTLSRSLAQNVFLVVIDGARYSETFGARDTYMPRIWNDLRPQGTIFTNFRNEGVTKTNPGHSSLITGTWQTVKNDGSERPTMPTVFEYFRKRTQAPRPTCFVVSGKMKLEILTHSVHAEYGAAHAARFVAPRRSSDPATWKELVTVMDSQHPRLIVVNFPSVDLIGHMWNWAGYLTAIRRADSLVYLLWQKIQNDTAYGSTTTLFVTNDHGRHDEAHGGFREHGDSCEGCRHIMLVALGPGFAPGAVVADTTYQIDVAVTVGRIMGFDLPNARGRNLLDLKGSAR